MRKAVERLLRKTVVACLIAAMLVGVMPVDMVQMKRVEAASSWYWPVPDSKTISQKYSSSHKAIDISGSLGISVCAAKAGTVGVVINNCSHVEVAKGVCVHTVNNQNYSDGGNTVYITHDDGTYTLYSHMVKGSISVATGQRVEAGQYIGQLGNSGQATGPHLHFGVSIGGSRYWDNYGAYIVDPQTLSYVYDYADTSYIPQGCVDSIIAGEGYVDVSGWVFDRDSVETPVEIHVYIGQGDNQEMVGSITANGYRPDVNSAYPGVGDYHGFWQRIYTNKSGNQKVYLYALNVGAGSENPCIGSNTVNILADTTLPVISNARIENVTPNGYDVVCTATDNIGVEKVTFVTWWNGTYDQVWEDGIKNGDTYTYHVDVSKHNNQRNVMYFTDILAYDSAGNSSSPTSLMATVPSNESTIRFDACGGTIALDTVTMTYGTGNYWDISWMNPTKEGYCFKGWFTESGYQVYDANGFCINDNIYWSNNAYLKYQDLTLYAQWEDTSQPIITDAKITNVTGSGYTVECTVTDNVCVNRVQFPTWTELNWQDDLITDWQTNSAITGTANGSTYTFWVKDVDHNFERGRYITLVYAFDAAGNASYAEVNCDLQNEGVVVAEGTYNGHTYQFIDDRMTWQEAKAACEALGGHLVTITSAEEQQAIESFLPAEFTSMGYYIGGYTMVGQPAWITGEDFEYTNWYPGEPSGKNDVEVEDVYHIYPRCNDAAFTGKWNDVASDAVGYGYICEFEPIEITDITLSKSEIEVGVDKTVTLEATVSPAEGYHPPITWTTANSSVATVSDGVVTGVGAGTTTITAECGGKTATCKVAVVKPFESITMNLTDKALFKNETCTLEVSYSPTDANASKDLEWSSANPNVATVSDEGIVAAVGAGTTTITATLKQNPQIKATCTVQVESYVVTFDTKGGSSIHPVELGKDEKLSVQEPTKSGYAFTGWYKDAECTIPWDMENDVVNDNITLYAGWMEYHEGLWIVNIPAQKYTGSAIKPKVEVYHYATKLTEGTDYRISYKNNKNAADKSSAKASSVIVTGKGNYTGKETATFTISAKNLTDEDITADDIFLASNGKVQKPVPVVTWNGKKLKNNKDYAVAYPAATAGAYQNNGSYKVRIVGKGNFAGERTIQLHITGSNLISKAKVSKIAAQQYTGKEIQPEFTVKFGSVTLTKGIDYTVSYENNISAGTARAVITGMGSYVGEKKVAFKIIGVPISKARVNKLPQTVVYDGAAQNDVNYELQMDVEGRVKTLVEGKDYEVSYKNNTSAGTATIQFKGINGYSGVLKKTFKILPYDLGKNSANKLTVSYNQTVAYMKGSTTIEPKVTCFGKTLKAGKDYKLTYKNNKQISDGVTADKLPTITISGKGNYSGSITLTYKITKQDIGLLNMTASDKVYQSKAGKCLSAPVIKDVNGKKLTAGKDYEKNVVYTYTSSTKLADGTVRSAGSVVEASDILPAGSTIAVTTKGMGNYTGEISCTYRIVRADISKAKATVKAQVYTGKAIEPGKSDITLKMGKTTLSSNDYEIVSYSNNVRKGTATVVVQGKGNYGGTKTIKFKIKSKVFSWWWR